MYACWLDGLKDVHFTLSFQFLQLSMDTDEGPSATNTITEYVSKSEDRENIMCMKKMCKLSVTQIPVTTGYIVFGQCSGLVLVAQTSTTSQFEAKLLN